MIKQNKQEFKIFKKLNLTELRRALMDKLVKVIKIKLGIPVKMTGKEFIALNRKVFIENNNLDNQIIFLKQNDCYEKEATFELNGGGVAIVETFK